MRLHWGLIIIVVVFLTLASPAIFYSQISSKSAQLNTDYANYLITATEGSVASAYENSDGNYLFSTASKREQAVHVFYETLRECFNFEATSYADQVFYYVPCVFLIDTNGYYIEYTTEYTDSSGHAAYSEIITPINKWAKKYGYNGTYETSYNVEFHLDDSVVVEYKNPSDEIVSIYGKYNEIYDKLNKPAALNFMSSYAKFYSEKTSLIINTLQAQTEYYINVHDESLNQFNNYQYQFTLPEITGEDWARLIDMPTVLSFLQGVQTPYNNSYLNIYAFAGSEIELQYSYYCTADNDGKHYHRDYCPYVTEEALMTPYSMYEAAKDGAYPCPVCVKQQDNSKERIYK